MNLKLTLTSLAWCLCLGGAAAGDEPPGISSKFRSITVEEGHTVSEIVCTGCSVEVRGSVLGDILTFGGNVVVKGNVKGDVVAIGGCVQLLEKSAVSGDAVAIGGYVESSTGIKPAGDSDSLPFIHLPGQRSLHFAGVLTFLAINVSCVLATALLLRGRRVTVLSASLKSHLWKVLGLGLGGLLFWQLIVILSGKSHGLEALLVSLEVLFLAALCLPGYVGASHALGSICVTNTGWMPPLLAGVFAISVSQMIPVVGFFLMLILLTFSLGSTIASGLGAEPAWLWDRFRRGGPASQ